MVVSGSGETNLYKGVPNTVRKYYKYSEQSWVQPTLEYDMQIVDNFCVYNYYHAFLPNTTYATFYRNQNRGWLEVYMYSPTGIIPKSFSFYVQNRTDASSGAYNIAFYGTNEDWVMHTPIPSGCNNSTRNGINTGDWAAAWTTIGTSANVGDGKSGTVDMSSNTQYYKWMRFECSTAGSTNNDRLTIKNFQLSGTQRTIVESTSSDYDFYVDNPLRSLVYQNNGTKPEDNYYIDTYFRPNVTSDTITYKETSSSQTFTSSSIGSLGIGVAINIEKAFNPTLGTKRVRPISATFTSTTVSSQWRYGFINAYSGYENGNYRAESLSSYFDGKTKGTYNITWNYSTSTSGFNYWWAFAPEATGWQSGTQTLAGTFTNIVWEVEGNGTVIDERYYAL